MWFTLYERSNEGARKVLTRYGGHPMQLLGYDCGRGKHREEREHDLRAVRRALEDARREIPCRCASSARSWSGTGGTSS